MDIRFYKRLYCSKILASFNIYIYPYYSENDYEVSGVETLLVLRAEIALVRYILFVPPSAATQNRPTWPSKGVFVFLLFFFAELFSYFVHFNFIVIIYLSP